ncbi:MAG TPA: GNAT family N-acetyltransferase [Jatrophihabitantaceae bacterium]|nr:GNAT family N-acetyltransferase [Jatrophihabitantaceae bacterium]
MTSTLSRCPTDQQNGLPVSDGPDLTPESLAAWVRQPWMVRVGRENILIRGANARDLPAAAAMHARCSARSLLERYRLGGRAPSPVALERQLRRTLSFVACTSSGEIVATAIAVADAMHGDGTAEVGILVRDDRQRRGLGRELLTHLSAGAYTCGYSQLITYTATSISAAHRMLVGIGRTYSVPDAQAPHLHTYLTESSSLGLGPVREHLAS